MRRATIIVALLVVAVAGVALLGSGSSSDGDYRVAAIFDTAKGMVAGQQVKIAGAVVGRVERIDLAPGPKARMELSVERRFAPFRADARCSIRPEGLISENFVECEPGRSARPLTADAAGTPVVALARTTVPVSLQDVIDVFALPTAERLRVFLSELGIAGAGRGDDLNALLRRANPALSSSERVFTLLAAQRDQLAGAVEQTDRVLARLGDEDRSVRDFVGRAADVAATTAERRAELGQAVGRLPAMLRAVRPGFRALDRVATDATPLLGALRTSGPGLTTLTRMLPRFADAGRASVRSVTAVARTGRPVIRRARPVVRRLKTSAEQVGRLAPEVDRFLVSFRDSGGIEGTMRLAYTLAILASSYDETSHFINFIANLAPHCIAAEQLNVDASGCSRKWDAPGFGMVPINQPRCGAQRPEHMWRNHRCTLPVPPAIALPGAAQRNDRGTRRPGRERPAGRPQAPAEQPAPAPSRPSAPSRLPALPLDVPKLLDGLGGLLGGRDGQTAPSGEDTTTALLDFLLK